VPSEVLLDAPEHRLARTSAANCSNRMTIARTSLLNFISHCDQDEMNAIVEAIHDALDLEW
jgi:mRNA-degrading endonuclease toxin of MazEF toxin-antitoxin module